MSKAFRTVGVGLFLLAVAGCTHQNTEPQNRVGQTAIAYVRPAAGQKVTGTVLFTQRADGVLVIADIKNLTPGKHGFHVHQNGDLSAPDLSSAGGHFNPTTQPHGGPDSEHHHAGDLGNLNADAAGNAYVQMTAPGLVLVGPEGIAGRSVIIHASADDLKSQPAGNSGARIAGGIIVLQSSQYPTNKP